MVNNVNNGQQRKQWSTTKSINSGEDFINVVITCVQSQVKVYFWQ